MSRLLGLFICAALLAGCASGKPYTEIATQLKLPAKGMARLMIYRTSALGMAIQPEIQVNGKTVGQSVPGGFYACNVPAGKHTILSKTENEAKLDIALKPGQTAYIKSSIGFGLLVGRIYFEEVTEAQGKTDLADLKMAESSCK